MSELTPPETDTDLYMIEFYEPFSVFSMDEAGDVFTNLSEEATSIEWIWAADSDEVEEYIQRQIEDGWVEKPVYAYRRANKYEVSAYIEGEVDGRMVASVKEAKEHFNGILYRMEGDGDGGFTTTKGFNCGRCKRFFDFEDNAVKLGDMYLSVVPEHSSHVLWHVCRECT